MLLFTKLLMRCTACCCSGALYGTGACLIVHGDSRQHSGEGARQRARDEGARQCARDEGVRQRASDVLNFRPRTVRQRVRDVPIIRQRTVRQRVRKTSARAQHDDNHEYQR